MAVFWNSPVVMVLTVIIAFAISGNNIKVVSGQCKGDLNGLMEHCAEYVQKPGPNLEPSKVCCQVVKAVDVPCVCQHIPKDAEQYVSMAKAIYVAQACGASIQHGMKCGSYTVP